MTLINSYMEGEVISRLPTYQNGQNRHLRLSQYTSLITASGEPNYFELARAGRLWVCSPGVIANFVAPVQDDPGTAAAYALYNPAASGVVLSVLRAWAYKDGGTNDVGGALVLSAPQAEATAVTVNTTGVLVKNASGSARSSPLFWATGVTLDAAGGWSVVAKNESAAAAKVGNAAMVANDLHGCFLVQQGHALGAHVISGAGTTPKFGIGLLVAELPLPVLE